MPIYEYHCNACEKRFEELILDQKPTIVHCPQCGTDDVSRLLSLFATSVSGSGNVSEMSGHGSSHACGCGHCTCGHGAS